MPETASPAVPVVPPQPDQQFVITAYQEEVGRLQEELTKLSANRVYIIAMLHQARAEFAQAQEMWQMERESLLKSQNKDNNREA